MTPGVDLGPQSGTTARLRPTCYGFYFRSRFPLYPPGSPTTKGLQESMPAAEASLFSYRIPART